MIIIKIFAIAIILAIIISNIMYRYQNKNSCYEKWLEEENKKGGVEN